MIKILFSTFLLAYSAHLHAGEIVSTTAEWRIDNHSDGTINAYYTGSTCPNGTLTIAAGADEDFKNRFLSILLAAKTTGSKVQIFYADNSNCDVTSVIIPRESEPLT